VEAVDLPALDVTNKLCQVPVSQLLEYGLDWGMDSMISEACSKPVLVLLSACHGLVFT